MAKLFIWHDFAAQSDSKIIGLRQEHGWFGYGIYWALIERLACENSHKLPMNFSRLAWDLMIENPDKVKSVVCDFGLFEIDEEEGTFHSERLTQHLEELESTGIRRREAARKGGFAKAAKFKERQARSANSREILEASFPGSGSENGDFTSENPIEESDDSANSRQKRGKSLLIADVKQDFSVKSSAYGMPIAETVADGESSANSRENQGKSLLIADGFEREKIKEERREKEKVIPKEKESKEQNKKERVAFALTMDNGNTDTRASENSATAKTKTKTTEEKVSNIPPYESYSGEFDTYSPEVVALCNEICAKFNRIPLPDHLRRVEELLRAVHRPGLVDGATVIRDGLKKLDTAKAIQSGKFKVGLTTFLRPDFFVRLIDGGYDEDYSARRKRSRAADAGLTFDNIEY